MFGQLLGKSGRVFQKSTGLAAFLCGKFCRLCRRLVILAVLFVILLSRPCFVFYLLAEQTGLGSGFERYRWEYVKALENGEDPLHEAAEALAARYVPDGKSVRIEEVSFYPHMPSATYLYYVQEDGRDLFPFYVRAVDDGEDTVIPKGVSLSERIKIEKDYMAHVAFHTDFKEQLFRYFLLKNNQAYYEEQGGYHVLRLDYPFFQTSSRFAVWNYEEGLVLSDFYDMDGIETVFRESVEDMCEWQRQIPEDLGMTVRITEHDSPEHFLSFHDGYGEAAQEVMSTLCDEQRAYNETLSEDEIGFYAGVMEEQARKDADRKNQETAQAVLAQGSIQEETLSMQIAEYYKAVSEGRLQNAKEIRGTDDVGRRLMEWGLVQNGLEEYKVDQIVIYRVDAVYDCALVYNDMKIAGIGKELPSVEMLIAQKDSENGWRLIFDLWDEDSISYEDADMLFEVSCALWEEESIKQTVEEYNQLCEELFEDPQISAWLDALTSDITEEELRIYEEMQSEEEKGEEAGSGSKTEGDIYIVRSGDCLWSIAERLLGDGMRWKELYERNKDVIGDYPSIILPGWKLDVGMK